MRRVAVSDAAIGVQFVRDDALRIGRNGADKAVQRFAIDCGGRLQPDFSAALNDTNDRRLVLAPRLAAISAACVMLTTDVGFVTLNRTSQRLWIARRHRLADAVAQVPRRLVRHSQ